MTWILTNDDGIDAPGIRALHKAVNGKGVIVAPKDHKSTYDAGNSISLEWRGTHGSEFIRLQPFLPMMRIANVALDCFSADVACR